MKCCDSYKCALTAVKNYKAQQPNPRGEEGGGQGKLGIFIPFSTRNLKVNYIVI